MEGSTASRSTRSKSPSPAQVRCACACTRPRSRATSSSGRSTACRRSRPTSCPASSRRSAGTWPGRRRRRLPLTAFDRDGVAAEYAVVFAELLAPKPESLDHVESARSHARPDRLAGPLRPRRARDWSARPDPWRSRWRRARRDAAGARAGCVRRRHCVRRRARCRARARRRRGGRPRGAHRGWSAPSTSSSTPSAATRLPARRRSSATAGGSCRLRRSRRRARGVVAASYFVVEPRGEQLVEIRRLVDAGELRPRSTRCSRSRTPSQGSSASRRPGSTASRAPCPRGRLDLVRPPDPAAAVEHQQHHAGCDRRRYERDRDPARPIRSGAVRPGAPFIESCHGNLLGLAPFPGACSCDPAREYERHPMCG